MFYDILIKWEIIVWFCNDHIIGHCDCIDCHMFVPICLKNEKCYSTGIRISTNCKENTFNKIKTSAPVPLDEHAIHEGPPTGGLLI